MREGLLTLARWLGGASVLGIFGGLLWSSCSHAETPAGSAVLSWAAPTQQVDGSPLTDLAGYRVYHGVSPGALTEVALAVAPPYTWPGLAPGPNYFAVTAINTSGIESDRSNIAVKTRVVTGTPPTPKPPGGLKVTDMKVYTLLKGQGKFIVAPIGTVPADTVCDPAQQAMGLFAVPAGAVNWAGTARTSVPLAACQ